MPNDVFIKVWGDVQGVGFRFVTAQKAQALNLAGWVRNSSDGSVEILAQGQKQALEELVKWCKMSPSGFAKVDRVETEWRQRAEPPASDFQIRY